MKNNNRNILLILAGIVLAVFIQGVSAQAGINDTEHSDVTVEVTALTMIDMNPAQLYYTAAPGESCGLDISGGTCNETGQNYYAIQVENIGSWNVTKIWFNVSQPQANPFAVGSDTYVDPGNFILLTTNETTNDFFFVDRKEYPTPRTLVYLRDPDGTMPANLTKFNYGRFHNASSEYFYMLDSNGGTPCNATEMTWIRIGRLPHTETLIGSTDFDSNPGVNYDQINLTTVLDGGGFPMATGNVSVGPLTGYGVAVENTTCAVRFSKWNKDHPFDRTMANYSFNGILTPGDSLAKKIGIRIDYGIYTGTKTGQVTAIAVGAS